MPLRISIGYVFNQAEFYQKSSPIYILRYSIKLKNTLILSRPSAKKGKGSFGKKEKNALYQLSDFYSSFYIKFIRHNHRLNENIWINGLDTPEQRAWSGYAFEQVCLAHLPEIKQALGITGVETNSSSWINTGEGKKRQIDLIIDRKDVTINLCEMKFSIKPFVIDKKYHTELRDKIEVFRSATKTTKSIFLTMITTFGVARNEYSNDLVRNNLTMDDLFM